MFSKLAMLSRGAAASKPLSMLPASVLSRRIHASPALWDKILVVDGIEPICARILRDAGHTVDEKAKLPASELLSIVGQYQGLVVRSETKVTVREIGLICVWLATAVRRASR